MLSVILLFMLMILLYSKCDQAFDLWQQQELASGFESDLKDTLDWGRKWLVGFNAGKTRLVLFDWSNNTVAIDLKMDGSVLKENSSFNMLWLTFCSKLNWDSYIKSIATTDSKRIGALKIGVLWSFFLLSLLLSLQIYHIAMYGILLSRLSWCS